jgi:hypothetical protein
MRFKRKGPLKGLKSGILFYYAIYRGHTHYFIRSHEASLFFRKVYNNPRGYIAFGVFHYRKGFSPAHESY